MSKTAGKRKRSSVTYLPEDTDQSSSDDQLVRDRVEEYRRLSDLNKRVMQYMLRIHAIDDYSREVRIQKAEREREHDQHMRELAEHYEERIEELEGNHGDSHGKLAELKEQAVDDAKESKRLEEQHESMLNKLNDTKERNKALALKVTQSESEACAAAQRLLGAEHDLDLVRIGNKNLQVQIADANAVRRRYNTNGLDSRANAKGIKVDHAKLQDESEAELKKMRDEVEFLLRKSSAQEDLLRSEFGTKLKREVARCQRAAQDEKERGLKEMKVEHDGKWIEFNNDLNQLNDEQDNLRQKIVHARLELKAHNNRHRGDRELAEAEERRADGLAQELETIEFDISKASIYDLRQIGELEDLLETKDHEYQQLLKIKDDLAMEIRAYRLLLENEEDRLGESLVPSSTPGTPAQLVDAVPPTVRAKKRSRRTSARTPAPTRRSTRNSTGGR